MFKNVFLPRCLLDLTDEEMELGRLRAQQRYEYWTCIRFVPWTSKTSSKYDLDHNNYLKHVDDDGYGSLEIYRS